jgi:hypothetical protein
MERTTLLFTQVRELSYVLRIVTLCCSFWYGMLAISFPVCTVGLGSLEVRVIGTD